MASYDNHTSIPLTVENPSRTSRSQEPLSTGLPIPRAWQLRNADALRLLSSSHDPIPCQFTPLAWWDDQAIKWILVHFRASVPAGESAVYTLVRDWQACSAGQKLASVTEGMVTVDTGALRFGVDKQSRAVLSQLCFKSDQNWHAVDSEAYLGPEVRSCDGQRLRPNSPAEAIVEENGSERVVLKMAGDYTSESDETANSWLGYIMRVEAYRSKSYLRIVHTLVNRGPTAHIADAAFCVPIPAVRGYVCDDGGRARNDAEVNPAAHQRVGVLQDNTEAFAVGSLQPVHRGKAVPGRFAGWITAESADRWAVSAAARHFWQKYPKSLELSAEELRIGWLPAVSRNRDSYLPYDEQVDNYVLQEGEARTHEVVIAFHAADSARSDGLEAAAALHEPLLALAPWEWYCDSQVLGDLAVRDVTKHPAFEQMIDQSLDNLLRRREEQHGYGDRNFGDDPFGQNMWNNCEYDYPHVGMLQFLRGAGRVWYDAFVLPAARHMMDIDMANGGDHAWHVYAHCEWHNGSGAPKLGSHAWLRGLTQYYAISGDLRARDCMTAVGRTWRRQILAEKGQETTERGTTWPIISMLAMYEVLPETDYLAAARLLVDKTLALYNPQDGSFGGSFAAARAMYESPSKWCTFLIGSPVLESLILYYQTTGDQRVKDVVVGAALRLARLNWLPALGRWEYTHQVGIGRHNAKTDRMISPAAAYASFYSGDSELWHKSLTAFITSANEPAHDGKELAQALGFGTRMPALIARADAEAAFPGRGPEA